MPVHATASSSETRRCGRREPLPAEFDVGAHAQVLEQAGLLEHDAHRAAMRRHEHAGRLVLPDLAVDDHASARRALQAGEAAQQRRLAAARGAEQRADAARGQRQGDVQRERAARQLERRFHHGRGAPSRFGDATQRAPGAEPVDPQQHREAEQQQPRGEAMRRGVFDRLDVAVQLRGDHARRAGDVAADHQHDAELADGVREAQHRGGDDAAARQRQRDVHEALPRPGAQRGGGLQRARAEGLERGLDRLHDEGHRVQHRRDDEPREAERQQADAQRLRGLADDAVRPHQHQQVEAQHRGRQHQRQRDQRGQRRLPARARVREPPRQRGADGQQQHGDDERELQCQRHRLQVGGQFGIHASPYQR